MNNKKHIIKRRLKENLRRYFNEKTSLEIWQEREREAEKILKTYNGPEYRVMTMFYKAKLQICKLKIAEIKSQME